MLTQTKSLPWSDAVDKILHIPFQPAIGIYWFVYAMIGLYLFAPFISAWLRTATRRQIEFFLILWFINMVIPWINFVIPGFIINFNANGNYYWELCYFGGFLGYWLLGFYLNRFPIFIGFNIKWIVLLFLTCSYPILIYILKSNGIDTEELTDNLQMGSAFAVAMLYTIMQNLKLSNYLQSMLRSVAKYSFGIYLTHIFIARELYWGIFENSTIHIFPKTFLIALLTLITGYVLTFLLSKIPNGKYIVGL